MRRPPSGGGMSASGIHTVRVSAAPWMGRQSWWMWVGSNRADGPTTRATWLEWTNTSSASRPRTPETMRGWWANSWNSWMLCTRRYMAQKSGSS